MTARTTRYLPYTLDLAARLIIDPGTGRLWDATTLDFLPGSVLRGAVAGRLLRQGHRPTSRRFVQAILSGQVRYLPAYPAVAGVRALPVPVSVRTPKTGVADPWFLDGLDLAAFPGPSPDPHGVAGWPTDPLADFPADYETPAGQAVAARRVFALHHQRDRRRGLAWTQQINGRQVAHGTLFSYESLEAGQQLAGMLALEGTEGEIEELAGLFHDLLDGPLLLGRSRNSEYGGCATVRWQALQDREAPPGWALSGPVTAGQHLRALLVSPYLGRDPATGHPDPTHLPTEVLDGLAGRASLQGAFWAHTHAGGFNRTWGLPLPRRPALTAGSVLVLTATDNIPAEDLLAVEHAGVGDRRIEGYGRVAFLPPPTEEVTLARPPPAAVPRPEPPPPRQVVVLQARVLAQETARQGEVVAARLARQAGSLPSPSLLGRLRSLLAGDAATAVQVLGRAVDGGLQQPARQQLAACRLPGRQGQTVTLTGWLTDCLQGGYADHLHFEEVARRRWVVSPEDARRQLDRQADTVCIQLIDTLLANLAVRARQESP